MRRLMLVLMLTIVAAFVLAACGGDDPTPTATRPPAAPTALPAWQVEMNEALAAAKVEGEVHVWVGGGGNAARDLLELEFEKTYPDIDVVLFQGARSSEIQSRYTQEFEAGVASLDIFNGGTSGGNGRLKPAGLLKSIKSLLVTPEVTDPKNWLGGSMWVDVEEQFMYIGDGATNAAMAIADSVDAASITSWESLLDPRFKGKIIMTDPRGSGGGGSMTAFWLWAPAIGADPFLGPDFITELFSTQEIVFSSDQNLSFDRLRSDKSLIYISPDAATYESLLEIGAAPTIIPTLPLIEGGPTLARMAGSRGILFIPNIELPHPNAAKIYVNWFYSQAGGQALVDIAKVPSRRADVDNSSLPPGRVPDLTGDIFNLLPTTCCVKEYRDLVDAAVGGR